MSYAARVDYTSDGVTTQFAIPFPYVKQGDIYLYLNAVLAPLTLTWINPNLVQLPLAQTAGVLIEFRRQTVSTAMIAVLQLGELDPADLNLDYTQLLYLIQELADQDLADELSNTFNVRATDVALTALPGVAARALKNLTFDAAGQPAVTGALTPAGIVAGTLLVYASQYATLALADAAAVALGGALVLDKSFAIPSNIVLTSKTILIAGGVITRGAHTVTFTNNNIVAGPVQWLDNTSGALLGSIVNDVLYPEWLGAIGTGNAAGLAAATVNSTAIQALEAFDGQTANSCRWLDFTGITYGVNATITNPTAGTALRWRGHGRATTRIFSQGNGIIRILTGLSAGSQMGVFQKNLGFYGDGAVGTASNWCTEVRDWCGWEHEDCLYDYNNTAIFIRDFAAGGFSENYEGRRNVYGSHLKGTACIICRDTAGTGSFRGFSEDGFKFSRIQGVSTTTFLSVGSLGDEFLYNGRAIIGTMTNPTTEASWVIDSGAPPGIGFIRSGLDLEQASSGSITIGKTNLVRLGGAGFQANGSVTNIKTGTAVFGVVDILNGVRESPIRAWSKIDPYTVTGNGAPFSLAETQIFQGTRHITLRLSSGDTNFQSYVDATVVNDDLGTAHAVTVNFVKTIYNTLGITFDTTKIGVSSGTGKLTFTANFGATVIDVSATVEHFGGQTQ